MTAPSGIEGIDELTEIGRGGFGVVYRGVETEYGRHVAVKVLNQTTDDQLRKRFARERRAMGSLSGHPNIVTVFRDGVTDTEQPYLVMEYLPGGSLADQLRSRGSLEWREAADIGAKLADALHAAHRVGILHRDVKPDNVLRSASGTPKLGDFGIARLDDGFETRSGAITASIAHAPPEVIDGKRADERADVYSLASTLHTLVAGQSPFYRSDEAGIAAMLRRITSEDPPALDLPSEADAFAEALMYGLAKDVDGRPDSAKAFAELLRKSLEVTAPAEPLEPAPPARPDPPAPPPRSAPRVIPSPPPFASSADLAAAAPSPPAQQARSDQPSSSSAAPLEPAQAGVDAWNARRSAVADAAEAKRERGSRRARIGLAIGALIVAAGGSALLAQTVFGETEQVTLPPVEPTAVVVDATATIESEVPEATEVPTATVEPTATSIPVTPTPTPTPLTREFPTAAPATGGDGEGDDGENSQTEPPDLSELIRVSDSTGAIALEVPVTWAANRFEATALDLWPDEPSLSRETALSVGGTFGEIAGSVEERTTAANGVVVTVQRHNSPVEQVDLLDAVVGDRFPDCEALNRFTLPLLALNDADVDVLTCTPSPGVDYGYFVMAATDDDDPTLAVIVVIAVIDQDESDVITALPSSLRIDGDLLPGN